MDCPESRTSFPTCTRTPSPLLDSEAAENDAEFVRQLLEDDARAWKSFDARYARLAFYAITRVTQRFPGVVQADDVRDIYATFLMDLLANNKHKLQSFDPSRGHKLGTWLALLATHTAYDFLRRARHNSCTTCLNEADRLASESLDPAELTVRRERIHLVREIMRNFTAKDRQFIALYYDEGLAPEEVAARMGIHIKTVYSKKHKIQNRLMALIQSAKLAA